MKRISFMMAILLICCIESNAFDSVIVPDIEDNSIDVAEAILNDSSLTLDISWYFSDRVARGVVIPDSQQPSAGSVSIKGSSVRAHASMGPFPRNLIGKIRSQAESLLKEETISYETIYGLNETFPSGYVYDQDPKYYNDSIYDDFKIKLFANGNPEARIISPYYGEYVPSSVKVAGKVFDPVDEDSTKLWIAVKSQDNWWPQSGGPLPIEHGEFLGIAYLGGTSNDSFEIALLMVNNTISDNFMKWEEISKRTNYWPPITKKSKGYIPVSRNDLQKMRIAATKVILK